MFHPGELVDERYDILGPLGQGGMAQVFRARDRHLEREVALKVLRPHLTETDTHRFRREIQALARFDHPGIVSIFDLGLGEHVYFAMELIEGGPFTDLGPFETDTEAFERLLGASITVAEALGYVHNLGMVHRDLTPRNILLTTHNHPKVMDFGLVQLTESSQELTRTGLTLGTPQYMAPEQARGDATGAHTDLYAFGAVLYRTLTGSAPFDAENDQAVLYQHVYGELTPAAELNPQIPPELSRLISALLSKEPQSRPGSAYAVADSLRAILESGRVRATHLPAGGPGRCGFYPTGPVQSGAPRRRWQVQLSDGPQFPAGIGAAEGFILVGLRSDCTAVLRPADGGTVTTFSADDEVSTAPIYAGGRLYISSRDGGLQAISWPTGRSLWSDPEYGVVGLLPYGDGVVTTASSGYLERRNADRQPAWRYEAAAPAATPPTLHRGQVAYATSDGWLHVVDALSGKGRLKVEVGNMLSPPVAHGGLLLLPVRDGELHAFDLNSREVLWSYDTAGEIYGSPAVWNGRVYLASWGRRLRCLSLRSGDDIWERSLDAPVTAAPVVAAGTLYLATESGELLAFDARAGRELWREQVSHSPIQASPLPLGDALVVASLDGTVTAFGS
ncbi:MAG TPA: PQQ-binding-like beta-propeller repeat protein [Trueperaceae bacterium]